MKFFDWYPRTDFHEMNLDWFLRHFKKLLADFYALGLEFDNLDEEVDALLDWFKNLNVSDEINNKLEEMAQDGTLTSLLTFQRGSSVSLQREAIITDFNCRNKTTSVTDSDYSFIQSICTDNEYVYMVGYAIGYNDEDHVKIMKYTLNFETKLSENVIEATHGNGSCVFNNKILVTNSNKTITVVNKETLIVETVINLESISDINLYVMFVAPYENNACLYVGTDTKWYILNNNYELLDTVYINYSGNLPNASGNACYYDGLVYKCGWPNVLFSFTLTGELINIYNIGTVQYDYIIGECEACVPINNKLYITTSEYAGWPTGTIITQIFEANVKHGMYEFYQDDKYIYSTRTIYVDANYNGIISDGTQEYPYKSLTWAIAECKALNNINRVVDINLLSDMPEYIGVAGSANIRINFNNHSVTGIRLQRVTNIRLRQCKIDYDNSFNYSTVASSFIDCDDSNNIYIVDCTITGNDDTLKPFSFYYCDIVMQSITLNNINASGHFEVGKYLIGSVTHNLDVFADTTFGTEIITRATNVKITNGSGGSHINQCRIYHSTNTSTPTENGTLVNNINLANYRWLTVCVNIPGHGSSVYMWHGDRGTFDIFVDYLDNSTIETAYLTLTKTSNNITVSNVGSTGSSRIVITDIFIEN